MCVFRTFKAINQLHVYLFKNNLHVPNEVEHLLDMFQIKLEIF